MKNLMEKVSEQLAKVGRVRSIHEFSANGATSDHFNMGASRTEQHPQG
ncbi:hypothetical protein Q4603_17580 [Zobellia galactanivorans]|nr:MULTISPECIES: hypothetical protein [Zobellia]MBU3028365.1 hypothetical protein [Zobellia galactanivorans]MDO6519596.1 hypothetical protein [Zobellia uliginosa]MDO6810438.1 hypothetical protein [Zobellia galactanivorans]